MAAPRDPRVTDLRRAMQEQADASHAKFHKGYHKSALTFRGLRTPAMRRAVDRAFPPRQALTRPEALSLAHELWSRPVFEERFAALVLLQRVAAELTLGDVPLARRLTHEIGEWALCDPLAVHVLGPLALSRPKAYARVRPWSRDRHLWTRRASVLIHVLPGRRGDLDHDHAWDTFEELLGDRDFFLRKAIGWTLRECSGHYAAEVHDFLARVGERASPLTRREGARKLPDDLRRAILGR